jgi:hypothetical protein
LVEAPAADSEGARLAAGRTEAATVGAGQAGAEGVGLLFEEGLQGALVEPGGGGLSDLLQGVEIDVESGPVVAEGAASDDFAPLGRQITEFLELLGSKLASRHSSSCLGVRTTESMEFFLTR